MRRIPLFLLFALCCAAADTAAQTTPRRPPADTVRFGRPAGDSIRMAEVDEREDEETGAEEADTVPEPPKPKPGPYARSGGAGPFSVQASGDAAPRPPRGEVVWVNAGPAPRVAARDSARRDTAAGTGQRVTSGQTARRDTSSATRPAARDTTRTGTGQRVAGGQTTRRDTSSATRPAPRDTTTRRNNAGRTGTSGSTTTTPGRAGTSSTGTTTSGRTGGTTTPTSTSARPRSHTVVAGETFYGIARRYGVTAAQLRALNPDVDMNALEVGDVLRLPAGARDRNAAAQPVSRPPQQQGRTGTQQPPRGSRTHTVAAGETLFGIARRYGVTVEAIRRANEMETDQVRAGQRLVIPPAS